MRSCIRPMHGALKWVGTKPDIRDAKVKSVSTIVVEAVDTHRDPFLGNFAKASASDFGSAKQAISEGEMVDAAEMKGGDAGEGKSLKMN